MAAVAHLMDGVWLDQAKVEEEEYNYHVYMAGGSVKPLEKRVKVAEKKGAKDTGSGVAEQIAQARQRIHQTLQESDAGFSADAAAKLKRLESDNADLRKIVDMLVQKMAALDARLSQLESGGQSTSPQQKPQPVTQKPAAPAADDDDDDSDIDLFGSDDEEEAAEAAKIREERLAAYAAKKAKKPGPIAKSSILLDVKPWDDETDMADLERQVRTIEKDGLLWGASKLVEIAYGIQKLQISCVVEDDKIGTDFLEEAITAFEDLVQSVDIAAFNKI